MHLHKRRLDKEAGLAAAGTADHKDILIPRVLRLLRAAVHGEPFRLCEGDIVLKYGVDSLQFLCGLLQFLLLFLVAPG